MDEEVTKGEKNDGRSEGRKKGRKKGRNEGRSKWNEQMEEVTNYRWRKNQEKWRKCFSWFYEGRMVLSLVIHLPVAVSLPLSVAPFSLLGFCYRSCL